MTPARQSKIAWAVNSGDVRQVTIYECPPNRDLWWCPELGYSCSGPPHEFFPTEKQALQKAIKEVGGELKECQKTMKTLELRLQLI